MCAVRGPRGFDSKRFPADDYGAVWASWPSIRLHSTGTVLGLFKDWTSPTLECQLYPGDILALYTDGVTESFNDAQEEFGEQRLVESLTRHREQSAQPIVASIVADVQRFSPEEQHDDITLIIAKCRSDS